MLLCQHVPIYNQTLDRTIRHSDSSHTMLHHTARKWPIIVKYSHYIKHIQLYNACGKMNIIQRNQDHAKK